MEVIMRKILSIIFVIILIASLFIASMSAYYFFIRPIPVQSKYNIRLSEGDKFPQLLQKLQSHDSVISPLAFKLWMRLTRSAHRVQTGEYAVAPGMTLNNLRANLVSGKVVVYKITFVEGVSFRQMMQQLHSNLVLAHTFTATDVPNTIMQVVSGQSINPEGWFFPATYSYHWGNSDLDILQRAHNKMLKILESEWSLRQTGLWYKNKSQALIVASLVQVESANLQELPIVASVILNRLKIGMRLQVDPTVTYGLGKDFGYRLSKRDLRQKTAYNTYRVNGLPPTAIDMPGRAAIHAALHPADTDYLYYVSRNDGTHKFSVDYAEHLLAVNKFQRSGKDKLEDKQGK
jgi:UPF0755 protein